MDSFSVKHPKSNLLLRVLFSLTTVSIMYLIFHLSDQSASQSSAVSGGFIEKILTLLPFLKKGEEISIVVESLQHIVRSLAHLTIFFALGSSVSAFICTYEVGAFVRFLISQIFCICYAVADEYHQIYVPGRSFQLSDILVDVLGSALGIVLVLLIAFIVNKLTNRRKSMRKKQLIKQLELMTQKLLEADKIIAELKNSLADRENDIAVLSEKLLKAQEQKCENLDEIKPTEASQSLIEMDTAEQESFSEEQNYSNFDFVNTESDEQGSDIKEYTVNIIGKIISETVKVNCVLAGGQGENRQELINLVLGRSEVAKEEISTLMHSGLSDDEIKTLSDKQLTDTLEYFKNILNQI